MNDKTMPELPEPHGWYLLTGHGNSYANQRPKCSVDAWKPAYGAAQMHTYALAYAYAAAQTPPRSEGVTEGMVVADGDDYLHALDMLWQTVAATNHPLYRRFADFLPQDIADAALAARSGEKGDA